MLLYYFKNKTYLVLRYFTTHYYY